MLWHRLALALGDTVTSLQERMPQREFMAWAALWAIEPWGEVRGDLQAALVAATLANIHRDRKQKQQQFTVEDFMPDFWRTAHQQPPQAALRAKMLAIFAGMAGNGE